VTGAPQRNFTGRGVPQTNNGSASSGSGRLFYETPTITIMNKVYSSFTDLQKTLGQLGLQKSAVLKLSFTATTQPLEEAMVEIEKYLNTAGESSGRTQPVKKAKGVGFEPEPAVTEGLDAIKTESDAMDIDKAEVKEEEPPTIEDPQDDAELNTPAVKSEPEPTLLNNRPVKVFAAPTSSTPLATLLPHDEPDYEPTIEQAKLHQARLAKLSQNKRLLSDAEIAEQERAHKERLETVKNVDVKIRYPSQIQLVSTFTKDDSAATLYTFVRSTMENASEPFKLQYNDERNKFRATVIKDEEKVRLVKDLGFSGKVLVTLLWEDGASEAARKSTVVKPELAKVAQQHKIEEVKALESKQKEEDKVAKDKGKQKSSGGGDGVKKIPKWLKMGKK
jgi:tether containing UBX domain for GLUT4